MNDHPSAEGSQHQTHLSSQSTLATDASAALLPDLGAAGQADPAQLLQANSHTGGAATSIKDDAIKLDSAEAPSEAAKKKKKKNKNKKKTQQKQAATSEACGPRSDNLFDKTQSSLRGGAAADLTSNGTTSVQAEARTGAGANPNEEADFTPLKDKIG